MATITEATFSKEQPFWFGATDRPLFGWLTRPSGTTARGGVILALPIGREAHAARRAMRVLALWLADQGFVSLRFDYLGTGDSSGDFDEVDRDHRWIESVDHAAHCLRSFGLQSMVAIGMRLGATIAATAAIECDLKLSSLVMWDPCESGRNYLRELSALEALRRNDVHVNSADSIETSEFVFSPRAAVELKNLNLPNLREGQLAERVLIVTRDDRTISDRLRSRLANEHVEWAVTTEQSLMLGVEPLTAVLPQSTMQEIVDWVSATESQFRPYDVPTQSSTTVFKPNASMPKFQERSIEIGPRHLFGIVTEPTAPGQGPLLVLLNVANEEHTGPSRLWVDLSRQWAGVGLRSVRFDLSGLGDSPGGGVVTQRAMYDPEWLEDVCDVARALSANDPTNVVYVGLCSGAFLAIEGALAQRARGVVAINPPVAMNFLHFVTQLEKSNRSSSRAFGKRLKRFVLDRRWDAAALWETFQLVTPSKFSVDVIKDLRKGGTELLLLSSVDDFSPYRKTPFFRSIDLRRLVSSPHSRIEIVPGLDHSMHAAKGRELAVKMIDQHVREHYASSPRRADSHTVFTEEQ